MYDPQRNNSAPSYVPTMHKNNIIIVNSKKYE